MKFEINLSNKIVSYKNLKIGSRYHFVAKPEEGSYTMKKGPFYAKYMGRDGGDLVFYIAESNKRELSYIYVYPDLSIQFTPLEIRAGLKGGAARERFIANEGYEIAGHPARGSYTMRNGIFLGKFVGYTADGYLFFINYDMTKDPPEARNLYFDPGRINAQHIPAD